ncbi:MAG: class I tRNA ligase family protein, partial [Patescibacteria group bacterium]
RRFIEKIWRIGQQFFKQKNSSVSKISVQKLLHKTIKKVSEDIEAMKFNTAISTLMILANEMESAFAQGSGVTREDYKKFLQILSPFAPHVAEELWQRLGHKKSISLESWPAYDLSKIQDAEIKIVVQINGKVRAEIMAQVDDGEDEVRKKALANEVVLRHLAGGEIKKVFYVKNRLINIVL